MALPPLDDTIAAIATAVGAGAIGIVRVSGPDSLAVAARLFRPAGGTEVARLEGHSVTFGRFVHHGDFIDEGLLLVFRAPRSYTGQDAVEMQVHGGPAVLRDLLAACLESGARQAGPGEFTLRAYVGGRLDLAQAESVLELVNASTSGARRSAALGLAGRLSEHLDDLQSVLTRVYGNLQARLDYPDEGVEEHEWEEPLRQALGAVRELLRGAAAGRLARHGARLALTGRPNAGKSSLLNALLGFERSLVSAAPGTTRDYVEAPLELAGVPVTLVDTAGIRDDAGDIERQGVELSRRLAGGADLVLQVVDPFDAPSAGSFSDPLPDVPPERILTVYSKTDLGPLPGALPPGIAVSSLTGHGLAELRDAMVTRLLGDAGAAELWIGNERHAEALAEVEAALVSALTVPEDLAALDLAAALKALARITGRGDVAGETLEHIFASFCVGK